MKEGLESMHKIGLSAHDKWISGGKNNIDKFTDEEMLDKGYLF